MDPSPSLNTKSPPPGLSGAIDPPPLQVQSEVRKISKVEPFFFNPTLKLAALRVTLLASAAALGSLAAFVVAFPGFLDESSMAYLGITPFILVHHFLSAFKLRVMFRLLDLALLIGEIVLLIVFKNPVIPNRFDPSSFLILFIASWFLVAILLFLLMCRIAAIIRHRGKNLLQPFDFLEDSLRIKGIPIEGFPAAYSMLIGRSIWRTQFVGEGVIVRLLRGFIAGAFITALIVYGILSLVIKPVQEMALTPIKESRGGLPFDQSKTIGPPTWNFIFRRPIFPGLNITALDSRETFQQAVNVSVLLSDDELGPILKFPCTHSGVPPSAVESLFQFIHVHCPDGLVSIPDVVVEVNYEPLLFQNEPSRSMIASTVFVYVGLTNNVNFLMKKTTPIALSPTSHYLSGVNADFRKVLKRPALSALGMFEGTNIFATATILGLVPDPLVLANPPIYNISGNSSTLRLYQNPTIESIVLEDWREHSVLGAFSAVGGLWTFLGGIFVLLFGTSLMRIFFNTRPLSIFGLAQGVEKDMIVAKYLERYPKIRQELNLPPSEYGIMKLLQDHMIDVALFEDAISDADTTKGESKDVEKLAAGSQAATPDIKEANDPTLRYRG